MSNGTEDAFRLALMPAWRSASQFASSFAFSCWMRAQRCSSALALSRRVCSRLK